MQSEKINSEKNNREAIKHRKRIKRLKAVIVAFAFVLVLMPTILSLVALMQIRTIDRRLGETQDILVEISNRLPEYPYGQNADIGELADAVNNASASEDEEMLQALHNSVKDVYPMERMAEGKDNDSVLTGEQTEGVKKVYLTFDDGPSIYTDDILDILDEYDVKATFFVNYHEGMEESYRRIVTDGHTLGMHSYSHVFSDVYADLDSFAEDYNMLHSYLYNVTGVDSRFYRFPGGSSNTVSNMDIRDCISYLEAKDVSYFDWNVSGRDAEGGYHSASTITNNVISQINASGSDTIVVLLHDASDKKSTVEALPSIIESIRAMDNVELLPITGDTDPVRHVD